MFIKQITLFIENRPGRLCECTDLLAKHQIDLAAISLADTTDFGILRVITDDYERALEILRSNGYTANVTEVLAIAVPDSPGGLSGALDILCKKDISIAYLYSLVHRIDDRAIIVLRTNNQTLAAELFAQNNMKILNHEDLKSAK